MNHLLTIGEGQLHLLLDNCFICCILHLSSGFWTQGVWVKPVFLYKGFSITFWTTCNSVHILQITGKYWSDSNLMGSQTPLSGQLCPQLDFKKCRKDGRSWSRERCCWGAVGRRMAEEGGGVTPRGHSCERGLQMTNLWLPKITQHSLYIAFLSVHESSRPCSSMFVRWGNSFLQQGRRRDFKANHCWRQLASNAMHVYGDFQFRCNNHVSALKGHSTCGFWTQNEDF